VSETVSAGKTSSIDEHRLPSDHHGHGHGHVAHQFETAEQQHESSTVGMWVFLAQEVMFLGAVFVAYFVYRANYVAEFAAAAHHLSIPLATANTFVLLTSSLTMAMAVHSVQTGNRRGLVVFLVATLILGATFLGIKGYEYYVDYQEHLVPLRGFDFHPEDVPDTPKARMFFSFYFALTGLHAVHMIVGIAVLSVIIWLAWRGRFSPENPMLIEGMGLYWHFVDIVWVFLFPILYLLHPQL
jgi:cytochrome c oxidase subunit III